MAINIGIVVFDDIIPFHLSVPCAVFEKALQPDGSPVFQLTVCATTPGVLRTNAGFSIVAERGLDALDSADIVVVPSWSKPDELPLKSCWRRCARHISVELPSSGCASGPLCWQLRAC